MFMILFSDTQDCSNFNAIDKVNFQLTMAKKVECLLSDQFVKMSCSYGDYCFGCPSEIFHCKGDGFFGG